MSRTKKTADAAEILYRRIYADTPDRMASVRSEYLNSRIAAAIYELRTKAGLTQAELAGLLGTKASAISRLEDADYEGHSLAILRKIAELFSSKLEIRFVPREKSQRYLKAPSGEKLDIQQVVA